MGESSGIHGKEYRPVAVFLPAPYGSCWVLGMRTPPPWASKVAGGKALRRHLQKVWTFRALGSQIENVESDFTTKKNMQKSWKKSMFAIKMPQSLG